MGRRLVIYRVGMGVGVGVEVEEGMERGQEVGRAVEVGEGEMGREVRRV